MIHKHYHPNGKPAWSRWVMECDSCHCTAYMMSAENVEWLVSAWPDMNIYCPDCFNAWADQLIISALRCPDCGCIDLRLWPCEPDAHPDDQHPGLVDCAHCGAILLVVEPPTWF
ncbi:hypothetical protein [Actinomadura montaniterrae]|uniref:Uncharacterized protein n=1 Tax=Actinomadura montaniterrae TaxID=1803903 RepID=A0A6L3VYH7_9ACTN|nr:hypothetical protein [Actinomadura montaniterrae]KAB2380663.1 hypothetical protein F9B16_17325 [Actinomadura montaniterrae]